MLERCLMVAAGGATGSLTRYLVGMAVLRQLGSRFPWGTMAVNLSGAFLAGLLMTMFTERLPVHAHWRLLLVTGFLGGYTTFSTLEWETYASVREGGSWAGFLNVAGSILLGYLAVWAGSLMARR